MEIRKVFCLFEQSGTFKNVFKNEFGIPAVDLDIENQFNETNYQLDLFNEIEKAYKNEISVFDNITSNDLIIAFFPCIYFSQQNKMIFSGKGNQFKTWTKDQIDNYLAKRERERARYFEILQKLVEVVKERNIKTIIENPHGYNWLLKQKGFEKPSLVIQNRKVYGDYYKKPTMFYFYNFEPSYLPKRVMKYAVKKELKGYKLTCVNKMPKGIIRSLISPEFAYNFINKYVLGIR